MICNLEDPQDAKYPFLCLAWLTRNPANRLFLITHNGVDILFKLLTNNCIASDESIIYTQSLMDIIESYAEAPMEYGKDGVQLALRIARVRHEEGLVFLARLLKARIAST
jgi:hypothetical protein